MLLFPCDRIQRGRIQDKDVGREDHLYQPDQENEHQQRDDACCHDHDSERFEEIVQKIGDIVYGFCCDTGELIEVSMISIRSSAFTTLCSGTSISSVPIPLWLWEAKVTVSNTF